MFFPLKDNNLIDMAFGHWVIIFLIKVMAVHSNGRSKLHNKRYLQMPRILLRRSDNRLKSIPVAATANPWVTSESLHWKIKRFEFGTMGSIDSHWIQHRPPNLFATPVLLVSKWRHHIRSRITTGGLWLFLYSPSGWDIWSRVLQSCSELVWT